MDVSDEELVTRIVATGDQRAFDVLVRRHQGRVRGWLRQLTRDPALADELAQIAIIRAWEKLETFSGQGTFSGWIMKLAYNVLVDDRRSHKRLQRLKDDLEVEESALALTASDDGQLPDLPRMLAILSADERVAMILCHAFGCSHAEASEASGIPLGTVKSHVRRGTEKIRKRFLLGAGAHE